ncbi:MAG: hypothetical protein OXT09_32820 [Myxococcales bacterium]|nr:hypothetical protein [Myxococcales bacterium]
MDGLVPPDPARPNALARFAPCAAIHHEASLRVGVHPGAASPAGMEDVLSVPAELLSTHRDAEFAGCRQRFGACLATELTPGAISAAIAHPAEGGVHTPYAFRCTF